MIRLESNLFYACYGFEYITFYLTLKDLDNLAMVNKMCCSVMNVINFLLLRRGNYFLLVINH